LLKGETASMIVMFLYITIIDAVSPYNYRDNKINEFNKKYFMKKNNNYLVYLR